MYVNVCERLLKTGRNKKVQLKYIFSTYKYKITLKHEMQIFVNVDMQTFQKIAQICKIKSRSLFSHIQKCGPTTVQM
jgi:hypothetical protein